MYDDDDDEKYYIRQRAHADETYCPLDAEDVEHCGACPLNLDACPYCNGTLPPIDEYTEETTWDDEKVKEEYMTRKKLRIGSRVYYRFDNRHPYEKQPQGEDEWGKGIVHGFAENDMVVVAPFGHDGTKEHPWLLFTEEELSGLERFLSHSSIEEEI